MKLGEILAPTVRTVGQVGRGRGVGVSYPGVSGFAKDTTSGQVSEAAEHPDRHLLVGTFVQEVTGHRFIRGRSSWCGSL